MRVTDAMLSAGLAAAERSLMLISEHRLRKILEAALDAAPYPQHADRDLDGYVWHKHRDN